MYQIWLRKSLATDYADTVVVADLDGLPAGYVTCHLNSPAGEGNIGLAGVAESARGKGCARDMVLRALKWFHEKGFDRCNVVTEGRNIPAQRLYQRCGFVTRSVELWSTSGLQCLTNRDWPSQLRKDNDDPISHSLQQANLSWLRN